jgi:hypothetical protein
MSKILCSLGLLGVFLIIFVSGRTNISNFAKVQSSIEEIYKDRLVVKGLIFELSTLLHKKEIATLSKDFTFYAESNESINLKIAEHLRAFRATRLTPNEKLALDRLAQRFDELQSSEKKLRLSNGFNLNKDQTMLLGEQTKRLKQELETLAAIQLSEGRQKMVSSNKAVDSMNSFAQVERYLLILFGVVMLLIIFFVPKPKDKQSVQASNASSKGS